MSILILEVHGKKYNASLSNTTRYWLYKGSNTTKVIEQISKCKYLQDVPEELLTLTDETIITIGSKQAPTYALSQELKDIWKAKRQGTHCKYAEIYLDESEDEATIRRLKRDMDTLDKQNKSLQKQLDEVQQAVCNK